ncbi:lipopolysaccharide biosynthesis protein [Pseudonocardia sp. N23]|uniref:lipopolysaccharide biosynthesis protein n=1 Tax=Pseudonocardia sp. N23 TaxID=1987376 RepID=UPI000C033505|nr:lipopolysaccharide biosynthesis protein [Pseudonocardia sp. N23]GAY13025.1 lipopolysaccharide biosynthesis protein WzxC [Pseudonocardia sp. N23]
MSVAKMMRPDELSERKSLRDRLKESTRIATSDPEMSNLSGTLRRGATYSGIALIATQLVAFVQTLVLARLLTPEELGVYVVGTILTGFLVTVSEAGLRLALIQRDKDVDRSAETVFWVTGAMGVFFAAGAIGTAPLLGAIFGDPTVALIAATNAGTLIIHGLTNVPDGLMQRRFNFRRRLIVDPARVVVFAVVTIVFAALGYGAWSQVIGNYAAMITWLGLSWAFAGWWPGFVRPSVRIWREMARFAYPLLLQALVDRVRTAGETAILGRSLSTDAVGQYRYGQRLSLIPANAVVQIGSYVLFPAMSRLADDPAQLTDAFLRALRIAWVPSAGVAALTCAIGEPAVVILLGAEWREAGQAFVAMSGYGLGIALHAAASEAIKATGRTPLLNWTTGTSIVLGIGLLVVLVPFGLIGVGLAISATELAIGVIVLVLTHRVLPFPPVRLIRILVVPAVIAAIPAAGVGVAERIWLRADERETLTSIAILMGQTVAFAVLFVAGLILTAPASARRVFESVRYRLCRSSARREDNDRDVDDTSFEATTVALPVIDADATIVLRVYRSEWPADAPTVPLIVDIRAVRLSDGGPSSDAPAVDNRTDAAPIRRSPPPRPSPRPPLDPGRRPSPRPRHPPPHGGAG